MFTYLIINLAVILPVFCLSFDRKVFFIQHWRSVVASIFVTGLLFIVWDVVATFRGDWSFNHHFVCGVYIFGLPIEELLFFITVPYACIFVYEVVRAYTKEKIVPVKRNGIVVVAVLSLLAGVFSYPAAYTLTVLSFLGGFLLLICLFRFEQFTSRWFWIGLVLSYIPFLIVNGVLTALPVVRYNSDAFSGFRIVSIPAEDFIYSFLMLTMNFTIHIALRKKGAGR